MALRPTLSGGLPLSGSFSLSSPSLRNFIGRKTYCVELVSHPLATLRCDPRPIQFLSYAHSDALASSRWEHYRRNSRLVSTKSIVPQFVNAFCVSVFFLTEADGWSKTVGELITGTWFGNSNVLAVLTLHCCL